MKLIRSTGKILEIYDIQEPIMKFLAVNIPLKENGYAIVGDDIARNKVRNIIDCGLYRRVK